jgi:hypothetical protein
VDATNRGGGSPIIILGTCPLGLYAVLMTNQILHLTNQPTTIMPNCKKFTGKLNGGEEFFFKQNYTRILVNGKIFQKYLLLQAHQKDKANIFRRSIYKTTLVKVKNKLLRLFLFTAIIVNYFIAAVRESTSSIPFISFGLKLFFE